MKGRLRSYRALAGSRPDWAVLRYEDMVLNFPAWLERLVAGFDLAPEPPRLRGYAARIAAENAALLAARREREEPLSHIRSIRPGDHASKLMPETISALTSLFADDLEACSAIRPDPIRWEAGPRDFRVPVARQLRYKVCAEIFDRGALSRRASEAARRLDRGPARPEALAARSSHRAPQAKGCLT